MPYWLYFKFWPPLCSVSSPTVNYFFQHRFDGETNLLHPSTTTFKDKPPSHLTTIILRVLSLLGLTKLTWMGTKTKTRAPSPGSKDSTTSKDEVITEATNLTILNVLLLRLGPMTEKRLVQVLIATQVLFILSVGHALGN